nr:hypothetical protein [Mycoplasmopsis bovis]
MLKIRWAFLKSLLIFTLIYIFNLPIIAKINNEINPLSLIFGIILAPIFEIYYLMSIMFFWSVDFMNFAYFILDKLLEYKDFRTTKKEQNKKKPNKKKWNLLPYVNNVFWSVDFMNFAYFILDKLLDVLIDFSYPLTIKISSSWLIVSLNIFAWFIVLSVVNIYINNKKVRQLA